MGVGVVGERSRWPGLDTDLIASLVEWLYRTDAPWHAARLREWGQMQTEADSEVIIPPFLRKAA